MSKFPKFPSKSLDETLLDFLNLICLILLLLFLVLLKRFKNIEETMTLISFFKYFREIFYAKNSSSLIEYSIICLIVFVVLDYLSVFARFLQFLIVLQDCLPMATSAGMVIQIYTAFR